MSELSLYYISKFKQERSFYIKKYEIFRLSICVFLISPFIFIYIYVCVCVCVCVDKEDVEEYNGVTNRYIVLGINTATHKVL